MKSAIIILLLLTSTAFAEDVTLDQAIAMYIEHNPRLAASRASIDVTGADVVEAHIYPNPELGLSTIHEARGDTAGANHQYQLDLSIPVLIGHQRARREAAALAHVTETKREVEAEQAEGQLAIIDKFHALLAAQERTEILVSTLDDTRKLRTIVAGRSAAGAGSSYAVERIDLEIASLASRVDEARADELSASLALAVAVGVPSWQPHAKGTLVAGTTGTLDAKHPLLAALNASVAAARADEARAHADAVPTPSLGLQAFTTNGPDGLALAGGVTIPLPMFDRNQGAVARARAEAHRSQLELAATTAELTGELDRATRELALRRDALDHYQAELARLPKMRDMAEASFKAGQGGIVELLDAQTAITDAKLRELELRAAVAEADLAVRRASTGR